MVFQIRHGTRQGGGLMAHSDAVPPKVPFPAEAMKACTMTAALLWVVTCSLTAIELPDTTRAGVANFIVSGGSSIWAEVDMPPVALGLRPGRADFYVFRRALWRPMERLKQYSVDSTPKIRALSQTATGMLQKVMANPALPREFDWMAYQAVPVPATIVGREHTEDVLVANWNHKNSQWSFIDDAAYLHIAVYAPELAGNGKRGEIAKTWFQKNMNFDFDYFGINSWEDGGVVYGIAGESKVLRDKIDRREFSELYAKARHPATVWREAVIFLLYRDYLYVRVEKSPSGPNTAGLTLDNQRFKKEWEWNKQLIIVFMAVDLVRFGALERDGGGFSRPAQRSTSHPVRRRSADRTQRPSLESGRTASVRPEVETMDSAIISPLFRFRVLAQLLLTTGVSSSSSKYSSNC